jgi:hypothetical protein
MKFASVPLTFSLVTFSLCLSTPGPAGSATPPPAKSGHHKTVSGTRKIPDAKKAGYHKTVNFGTRNPHPGAPRPPR